MRLHEISIFQTVKSKVIIPLFETVRLSVSISLRNLYNSLNSIKEMDLFLVLAVSGSFIFTPCRTLFSTWILVVSVYQTCQLKPLNPICSHYDSRS